MAELQMLYETWQACEAEQSKRISELQAQNAELAEALQKHGRHLDDCAFLPNWIDHECNCGLFKLLNKTKECLAESK